MVGLNLVLKTLPPGKPPAGEGIGGHATMGTRFAERLAAAVTRGRKPAGCERGANLVELALVLGLILIMLAAAVDFGRVFQHYIVISNAAREGARQASLVSGDADDIREAATREAAASEVTIAPDDITITGLNADPGQPIEVRVRHRVPMLLGAVLGFDEVTVESGTVMIVAYAK